MSSAKIDHCFCLLKCITGYCLSVLVYYIPFFASLFLVFAAVHLCWQFSDGLWYPERNSIATDAASMLHKRYQESCNYLSEHLQKLQKNHFAHVMSSRHVLYIFCGIRSACKLIMLFKNYIVWFRDLFSTFSNFSPFTVNKHHNHGYTHEVN